MALANVAWILASAGHRVLAIDWDLESPGLHRYFHPFLLDKQLRDSPGVMDLLQAYVDATLEPDAESADDGWVTELAQIDEYATSLDWDFSSDGFIDFVSAGTQDQYYSKNVSKFDWINFFERLNGGAFLKALRVNLRKGYDYVLIDSRTGLSDGAGICTVTLPDIVVACFTMSTQSIEGAGAVARSIEKGRAAEPVQILPVPMRVEDAQIRKLEAGRDYAREVFSPFLVGLTHEQVDAYWGDVEIPYKSFYAYEEILSAFGDRSRQADTLLVAFERLTSVISQGRVRSLPVVDEANRRRWLTEFERTRRTTTSDVVISYAAVDRMWAEWISSELGEVGMRVVLHAVDFSREDEPPGEFDRNLAIARRAIVLLSPDYVAVRHAAHIWRVIAERDNKEGPPFLVPIRLSGARLSAPFADRVPVDFAGLSADRARGALLSALDQPLDSEVDGGGELASSRLKPRFPATLPPVWNVPARNSRFTGRGSVLEQLRDGLAANVTVVVPQTLYGLGGVGKTQLALEYAYRFAADYDLVWWMPAEQADMARSALADLAVQLRLPTGDSTDDKVQAVLDALGRGAPARWLLVFDNADDPSALRQMIPPRGAGHVLITSRNQAWAQQASAIEVGVFSRQESIDLLLRRVPELDLDAAGRVAEKLGDLPLAVEQAGAWLAATAMSVESYLDLLDHQLLSALEENLPQDYPRPAAATWRLSLERLERQMPAAVRLLQICAFFGPEPIPTSILERGPLLNALLLLDPSLDDTLLFSRVLQEVGKFALARIDASTRSIQMHRLVQAVFRNDLDEDQQEANRLKVHEGLAAANPKETDEPENWPMYASLSPHIEPSGGLESDSPDVRRLVYDIVRYRWKRGDFTSAQEFARRVLEKWEPRFGSDNLVLILRLQLANCLRSQARYRDAHEIDNATFGELEKKLGPDHPYTLMAKTGLGGDLRGLGRYKDALIQDQDTMERLGRVFDADHARTLMAANNLANSLRLRGKLTDAANLDQDTLQRRRRVLGERHPYTLFSASSYGRDLRELGNFEESRNVLESTLEEYRLVMGPNHPDFLRCAKSLAVTLRKLGEFELALERTKETLGRYRKVHGSEHADLLACEMNLACDQSALGDDASARGIAEGVLKRYRGALGAEHTFSRACENNLAIFIRKTGDYSASYDYSQQVVRQFRELLGEEHPYTLACVTNLANDLYAMGDYDTALQTEEENYEALVAVLGPDHPDTLAAGGNLAVTLQAVNERDRASTLMVEVRERFRRTLGDAHPNTLAVQNGLRLNCDIEPPPT